MIGAVRIAIRSLAIVMTLCGCVTLFYAISPFVRRNPMPRLFMAAVGRIFGLAIRVEGTPPRTNAFIIANHVSWLDIPALAGINGTAFVAHDGLKGIPWLRWICSLNDTVFIARHRRDRVSEQVGQIREAIEDAGTLAIFPEGTTADGKSLLPFKSSLLSALTPVPPGLTVQPVWLDYGQNSPEIAWTGAESGKDNFLKIASQPGRIRLTVHFLPALGGDALADRKAMARAARISIEEAMAQAANRAISRPNADGDQRVAL